MLFAIEETSSKSCCRSRHPSGSVGAHSTARFTQGQKRGARKVATATCTSWSQARSTDSRFRPAFRSFEPFIPVAMRSASGFSPEWEETARASALVSTSWLEGQLGRKDLAVLDVRGNVGKEDKGGGLVVTAYKALKERYAESHIPGAVFGEYCIPYTQVHRGERMFSCRM